MENAIPASPAETAKSVSLTALEEKIAPEPDIVQSQTLLREQSKLAGLVDHIQRFLDLDILFKTTVAEVRQLLKADRVAVFRFYPELEWEGEFIAEDVDFSWQSAITQKIQDHCFSERFATLYQQGRVNAIADIYAEQFQPCYVEILERLQVRANVVAPLLKGNELWGLLCVHQCSNPRQWESYEVELVSQIAQRLGVALGQNELLLQAQFQAEQQKALTGVINRIRQSLDLNTVFQTTVTEVRQLLKSDRAGVFCFLPDSNWNDGEFISEDLDNNWDSVLTRKIHDYCFGTQFAVHYQQGRIQAVTDIHKAGFSDCHLQILSRFHIRANLVVPLLKGKDLWGLLCVHQCDNPRQWESYEIEFVAQIAEQLGVALQQADYLEQVQSQSAELARIGEREKAIERQKTLAITIDKIRRSLDIDIIFETTTQEVRQLLEVERVAIYRFCSDWSGTFVAESVAKGWTSLVQVPLKIEDTYLQMTQGGRYAKNQTLAIDDIYRAGHADCHIALLEQFEAKAYAIAPIFQGETLWGLLAAYQNTKPRHWEADEIDLLAQVGGQLGIALQQAELLKRMRQQAQELNQTIQELQHSQSQLIQKEKMAALGQLVAGIAHEINNPVNFIYGNLSHVSRYMEDLLDLVNLYQFHSPIPAPAIQEKIDKIDLDFVAGDLPKTLESMKMGADRIRQIVLSLRNFSRTDEAQVKPVNIHEGIDSTLLILQHRLKKRSNHPEIAVIKEYGKLPLVECYAAQLNQVFMNIISNGIDAIEEMIGTPLSEQNSAQKTPVLWIRTEVIQDQTSNIASRVLIRIADNALGMPEQVRSQIFNPFFTTKTIGKGTGLGLAISYQIVVERHNGQLKCTSEPGKGTEFWIEIPILEK